MTFVLRRDPDAASDELTTLTQFLDFQRATLLLKTEGVDAAGMVHTLPTSTLTLAGLLKHLALVEDDWMQVKFLGHAEIEPWASAPWDDDRDWEFNTALTDDANDLRLLYAAACERSRAAATGVELSTHSVKTDRDGANWNLRWILVHLIEETSRHNGHADLLREAIDGVVGE